MDGIIRLTESQHSPLWNISDLERTLAFRGVPTSFCCWTKVCRTGQSWK